MQITSEIARQSNPEAKRIVEEKCLKLLAKENLCAGQIADLLNLTLYSVRPALSRLQKRKQVYLLSGEDARTDYVCREQKEQGITKTSSAKYALLVSGQRSLFN